MPARGRDPQPAPATLPQPVHLYRLDSPQHHCPYGERARQLLLQHGIPFQDRRLTSQEEAERFKAAHGVNSTPQHLDCACVGGNNRPPLGTPEPAEEWSEGGHGPGDAAAWLVTRW